MNLQTQLRYAAMLVVALGCGDNDSGQSVGKQGETVTQDGHRVIGAGPRQASSRSVEEDGPPLPDTARWIDKPTSDDPQTEPLSLAEAVEGLPLEGKLVAEIRTDLGFLFCDLFADRKPKTVAHFIALARGKRAWWDASAGAWRKEPLYADSEFFRVVPDEMIMAGGVGKGLADIAVKLPFEKAEHPLIHDRKGQLILIDGGGKFAISDGPNRELDGKETHSIFGQCYPEDLVFRIARVPQWGSEHAFRPRTRVAVHRVVIRRSEKGADKERPQLPEGRVKLPEPRGASRGPSEMRGRHKKLHDRPRTP